MASNVKFGKTRNYKPLKCCECQEKVGNDEAHAINGRIYCETHFKELVTGNKENKEVVKS